MSPLFDFLCGSCGHVFEQTVDHETRLIECPHECGLTADRLPPLIGGYSGNMGGSSTRPRYSGAFKKARVFVGNELLDNPLLEEDCE